MFMKKQKYTMHLSSSELILNKDGSIYHLRIHPEEIADDVITVGDPDRIDMVLPHFSSIEFDRRTREFRTVTGICNSQRLTVISTGIGTDNIDIVLNEVDALKNIDLKTRTRKPNLQSINIYRIGTSGTLQKDIDIDSLLVSAYAVGMGGLAHYYANGHSLKEEHLTQSLISFKPEFGIFNPYTSTGDLKLQEKFLKNKDFLSGITITAPGFYGPQGRNLRLQSALPALEELESFTFDGKQITNLEMETAGIYFLATALGHRAISLNALLANRITGAFSSDPQKTIEYLIQSSLEIITS